MTLSIQSPDELVALIPHLLVFQPEESIVFLPSRSELPAARVDIPTTARDREDVWRSISDESGRHAQPGSTVAIVCITADRNQANAVGLDFAGRLADIGIQTPILLWADDTRWADLDTGDMGLQTDAARESVAAMAVLSGQPSRPRAGSRWLSLLSATANPWRHCCLRLARPPPRSTGPVEGRWAVARVQRFQRDGVRLSDSDAARLLVAVENVPVRDRLWLDMNQANSGSHVALWADVFHNVDLEIHAGFK
ncbi:DUF4192 family protein [Rudaeicoccus suwonensis]|uniref:Uncharacterized protein DUF4192 n=1 Tax=Rudaeicoccus suwonensis TaxID=657409 RepID=A0A561EC35_9MICO|nr:DUF4192 family protein [Rudaeicoccus suwonensis]TWE13170.1 uncharacterized protein DUF4192 [Rudaeicoccus suwonensis]